MSAQKGPQLHQQVTWQEGFLELLPAIHAQVCFAFRRLRAEARAEAIQEAIANALVAYVRLTELGKQCLAFATPLARFAVRQVCQGRRVGGRLNVRDVMSPYCQRQTGVKVERLSRYDRHRGQWRELLIEDRRASPADLTAIKLDFQAWLNLLPLKKRQITETLANGERPMHVARSFGISRSRISQLRQELGLDWQMFHGELDRQPSLSAA